MTQIKDLNRPFTDEENQHVSNNELVFYFTRLNSVEKQEDILVNNINDLITFLDETGASDKEIIKDVSKEINHYFKNPHMNHINEDDIHYTIQQLNNTLSRFNHDNDTDSCINTMIQLLNEHQSHTLYYIYRDRQSYPKGARELIGE